MIYISTLILAYRVNDDGHLGSGETSPLSSDTGNAYDDPGWFTVEPNSNGRASNKNAVMVKKYLSISHPSKEFHVHN